MRRVARSRQGPRGLVRAAASFVRRRRGRGGGWSVSKRRQSGCSAAGRMRSRRASASWSFLPQIGQRACCAARSSRSRCSSSASRPVLDRPRGLVEGHPLAVLERLALAGGERRKSVVDDACLVAATVGGEALAKLLGRDAGTAGRRRGETLQAGSAAGLERGGTGCGPTRPGGSGHVARNYTGVQNIVKSLRNLYNIR